MLIWIFQSGSQDTKLSFETDCRYTTPNSHPYLNSHRILPDSQSLDTPSNFCVMMAISEGHPYSTFEIKIFGETLHTKVGLNNGSLLGGS